ncbi:MAG: CDP-diacylglycerol--serine O-phosphatidyltransferase [Endomicrobium sp.]|jgi:CDP-diacylglycerol--serine O-phosphatidyltransferase|nr:CDP-diacylglycerol--serine O-phosphatidyltransferase [Endomicrobium sp.]
MKSEKLKKGVYIIPSLFTCANISCGFLSIISSINGYFTKAAWLVVFAIIFDIIDGRIARFTKTTSEFGIQLDSLSDMLSFGVAPSIIMYQLVLNSMGKLGISVAVFFVLCSALRLAKFNTATSKRSLVINASFMGLPTPASAGFLISFVLSYELFITNSEQQSLTFKTIPILMKNMPIFFSLMPIMMVILSLLEVSNIPYLSFKKVKLFKPKIFRFLVLLVSLILLIIAFPQNIIFILFVLYVFSGIFGIGMKYYRIIKKKINFKFGENNGD